MLKGRNNKNGGEPSILIPTGAASGLIHRKDGEGQSPITPVTPKTPADEGIEFFQTEVAVGEAPICLYELRLEPDGGPSKELSVRFGSISSHLISIH